MSKIDELLTIAKSTDSRVATIEQWIKDKEPRCNAHGTDIEMIKINLNGTGDKEGINEWRRNFNKRHALISTLVPIAVVTLIGIIKHKLTGRW